jgi:hypothetical protein
LKHLNINELLLNMLTGKIDGWMQRMVSLGSISLFVHHF